MMARIVLFGTLSGLLWSVIPGTLNNLFTTGSEVATTLGTGVVAGVVTSALLTPFVLIRGRCLTIVLGLLSLPLGAFVFGAALALTGQFFKFPAAAQVLVDPWILGAQYALLSVISIFALGLFPLAVLTTLLLRTWLHPERKANNAV